MLARISTLLMVLFCATAQAGPSVSGGMPPHPAMTTMSLEAPIPGVDIPTDAPTRATEVLVLWEKRILILDVMPTLELPRARVDFPTDSRPPLYKILVLDRNHRYPVMIGFSGEYSYWRLPGDQLIPVQLIVAIESAKAGIDYPTDGPAGMDRNFLVMVLKNGARLKM